MGIKNWWKIWFPPINLYSKPWQREFDNESVRLRKLDQQHETKPNEGHRKRSVE
jgi:hypothetical protein